MPYFRHYDVYREADLIEEVARVHGLQRLPATLPARRRAVGGLSRTQKLRREIEDQLRGAGLSEVVTFASCPPRRCAGCGSPMTTCARGCCRWPTRSAKSSR